MNISWIHEQAERNVSQFDKSMELACPDARIFLQDPKVYLSRMTEQCNYFEAVKHIDWASCLGKACTVLDLGCGGGWLTGYLSKFDSVNKVYALDSSKYFLFDMMPKVIALMNGREEKIIPIEGLFSPLMFGDGMLDVVVASSVLHHADSLETVLREIRRVLKSDGVLVILNETPSSGARHVFSLTKAFFRIVSNVSLRRYQSVSASVSACGYLYDPLLGDRDYPQWYWEKAIGRSGFIIAQTLNSGMPTLKAKKGRSLIHFICQRA